MFKAFKFCLYQLFTLSLLFNTIQSNEILNREMIILLETTDAENIDKTLEAPSKYHFQQIMHPVGMAAMTLTLLIALDQKVSPIITNKALLKNVIDHQNLFSDFLNLDINSLYNLYGHYNRFQGHMVLDNFKTNCRYIAKSLSEITKKIHHISKSTDLKDKNLNANKILEKIASDPLFNLQSLPRNILMLNNDPMKIQALQMEMMVYTFCNSINFNDWQIKKVNEDIFMLIPKDYIKNLNLKNSQTKVHSQKFTDLEIQLGLKIDHMKNIDRSFFEQPFLQYQEIPFIKSLQQIFITNSDIKTYNLNQIGKIIWSMHMAGHGLPKCRQLGVLPQLQELKKLFETKLQNHKAYKNYLHKIKKLEREIRRMESFIFSPDKKDHGLITSLPINEFRDMLKFFNEEIEIILFHYTSCYAGGAHLIEPYVEIDNVGIRKPLNLKYTVICGCPAENTSILEYPYLNLPPYENPNKPTTTQCTKLEIKDIDLKNKRLKFHGTLNFKKFFAAVKKGIHNDKEKLLLASHSLHPFKSKIDPYSELIANIPLVRMAHSDHFEPIQRNNSYLILDAKNCSKPIVINKEAVLLYNEYISGKMTLEKLGTYQNPPHLFSMIPGFALHTFEEIDSSSLNLNEIVNSFLTFPELSSSKIFWIKKLKCRNKKQSKETFNDVIIMRNVFNSDTLARCDGHNKTRLETCAYFSTNSNNKAKLTWDGPFIEDNNYRINPWKNDDHKEECLHNFPKLANFLNPVLQSI